MKDKKQIKKIAVFTSGGDAPGMNAAIRSVVRTASYNNLEVMGIENGYDGIIKGKFITMTRKNVANILHRGGTILKTARSMEFMTKEGRALAYENIKKNKIDALVAIGGNGTYTGALVFGKEYDIPIVGLPGTIDNDIYGTDYTIGFDTAINTAIEAVDRIRDTADSHNRLFFVEVMGRHSGYIALYTGIGSGSGSIFLPETEHPLDNLIEKLKRSSRRKKLFNLVIVAEGNKNGNAISISELVKKEIPEIESRVAIIGHLQRGGSPSCADRVLASRLGFAGVNGLLEGQRGVAVGTNNNDIVFTPLLEAIDTKKELPPNLINMADILAM